MINPHLGPVKPRPPDTSRVIGRIVLPLNTLAFLCQLLFVWNTFAMAQKGKWERHAVSCIEVRGDLQLLVWEDDELYTGTALTMRKGGVVKAPTDVKAGPLANVDKAQVVKDDVSVQVNQK